MARIKWRRCRGSNPGHSCDRREYLPRLQNFATCEISQVANFRNLRKFAGCEFSQPPSSFRVSEGSGFYIYVFVFSFSKLILYVHGFLVFLFVKLFYYTTYFFNSNCTFFFFVVLPNLQVGKLKLCLILLMFD